MALLSGIGILVVLAGVLYLVYHFERARWAVAALVLAIGLALVVRHLVLENEDEVQLTRIDPSEIALEVDFNATRPGGFTPRGYDRYTVTGRVFNNSDEHALTELGLRVQIEDCPVRSSEAGRESEDSNSDGPCTVVSEGKTVIETRVPPNQARDFVHEVQMPQFSPQGEPRWAWGVEYIRAE